MRDAGYTMMLLDDCWAAHDRDENGELQPMPWAFPSGNATQRENESFVNGFSINVFFVLKYLFNSFSV
mgnify:CR=1 FL=1